jgi:hypothetical protein
VDGEVRDENAGVLAEHELTHVLSKTELTEHFGLKVEDLGWVVKQEERMLEQYFP